MAQLLVRGLDEGLVRRLKLRAAEKGRSAEAEHREILRHSLAVADQDFWDQAESLRRATEGRRRTDSARLLHRTDDSRS